MRVEAHELVACVSCGVILHYGIVDATDSSTDELLHCPVCKNVLKEKQ